MVYLVSILALVAIFAIATVRPINMGLIAFAAAFLVAPFISNMSIDDVMSGFPGEMFIVVLGITLLFGIAQVNGTLGTIMRAALHLVGGRRWAVAWAMFVLSALLMSLGAVLAVSMLAPIAMPLAKRYRINPLLMSAMIGHGAFGAAFSPITVYSVGIQELLKDYDVVVDPLLLFVVPLGLNLAFACVAFAFLGRDIWGPESRDIQRRIDQETPSPTGGPSSGTRVADTVAEPRSVHSGGGGVVTAHTEPALDVSTLTPVPKKLNWEQGLTLTSIVALLACAMFGVDVGVASLIISVVLLLVCPTRVSESMKQIAWPAALLVCGVVTYMGVLTQNGTIEYLGDTAARIPSVLLTVFALLFAIGVISAVGSSFGIILIALPLAAPLMASGQVGAIPLVLAVCFCATVVDVSPFSTNGVIVLSVAQVEDKLAFQRKMLAYCGYICVAAPLASWALLVLPTI
ncbi:SLC13 family permease [Rhodococcus sp. NBC_00297]|uniref:SLC13 family permease n=1 Tax=Rhodococcus sp. NBC_00297 TaxID=2976005 RepID=UPI002E2A586B|nr:SLC13 family permease [Rhodococcus sp. NBC_00297]